METPREYYYTYYSYEEWGKGYIGSRKCYCLPKEDINYFGTFKDKNFKPTQKIILKDDYATREEALADEIILQQYYKVVENPHFANRAYQTSTKFYVPTEQAKENGRKNMKKQKELGTGFYALTPEKIKERTKKIIEKNKKNKVSIFGLSSQELSENGKKGGSKTKELGVGFFKLTPEERSENAKKYSGIGGKKAYKLGVGIHSLTPEEKSEAGKKGGKIAGKINGTKNYEMKVGIHGRTKEQRIEDARKGGLTGGSKGAKKTNSQKWMCLETGYITNAGALSTYQKARGIDTSKRKRIA